MHPVQAIAPLPNTQSHLLRMVSTLEKDFMKSQPPASVLDLEQYAEGTSSQLLYLQVHLHPSLCIVMPGRLMSSWNVTLTGLSRNGAEGAASRH